MCGDVLETTSDNRPYLTASSNPNKTQERLKPGPADRVVDLGGGMIRERSRPFTIHPSNLRHPYTNFVHALIGTGNFSAAVHRLCKLQRPILCVDPSEALLVQAKAHPEGECIIVIPIFFE